MGDGVICTGSGQRWAIGDGQPMCQVCHHRWHWLGLKRKPKTSTADALVPLHDETGPISLTAPQRRYVFEILAAGPDGKRYNSRAEKLLKRLQDVGLVTLDVEVRVSNRSTLIWTAVATDAAGMVAR